MRRGEQEEDEEDWCKEKKNKKNKKERQSLLQQRRPSSSTAAATARNYKVSGVSPYAEGWSIILGSQPVFQQRQLCSNTSIHSVRRSPHPSLTVLPPPSSLPSACSESPLSLSFSLSLLLCLNYASDRKMNDSLFNYTLRLAANSKLAAFFFFLTPFFCILTEESATESVKKHK